MATIVKVPRTHSISYRAIAKRNGTVLTTKCFKTRTAARQWARRIERDAETTDGLGEAGARLTLAEVASEHMNGSPKQSLSQVARILWWTQQLGRQLAECYRSREPSVRAQRPYVCYRPGADPGDFVTR